MNWNTIRFDWNRARAFLATAHEGTFSAAARALETTQPTIGRQIAALEEELGVMLFERLGNELQLTKAGLDLLEYVREMGESAAKISLTATGQSTSIEGTVSISASEATAAFLLPPLLAKLRADHPKIRIDIVASNATTDLQRREADIAIRNFKPTQLDLIARKVGVSHGSFYATPEYVADVGPIEQTDLSLVEFFAWDRANGMADGLRAMGFETTSTNFPIMTGNHLVQWEYCKAGLGVCVMTCRVGDREPSVVRVFPEFSIPVPVWLVCHGELRTSRRIRLVFDLLADYLSETTE